MTKSEFAAYLEPFVTQAVQDTGTTIKPSVIIARALIESGSKNGFGVSPLQMDANNFFGFTCNKIGYGAGAGIQIIHHFMAF